ncbi:MAG: nucleotidyltransferase family protein [Pseudolabrys sp.]|nr:nucleotidyltransferase family protein [Pseudolabrys sp.]
MKALPDEFVLVAACCRWPASLERDAGVMAAAGRITDWQRVLRVAIRHRVEGLVHAALVAAGTPLPPDVSRALLARAQRIAARNMANAVESVRLQALFDKARIPLLVIKGAGLAQLGYGTLVPKQSKDIDLLSAPEHADAAVRLLEGEGYELRQPAAHLDEQQRRDAFRYGRELALQHPAKGMQVELRWRLVASPSLLKGVDVGSRSQTVVLPGIRAVRTFQDDDLFAYLCLHGAAHGWSKLKWLADVNALIASKSDAELLRYVQHARAKGTGVCAGLALLLCHRVLGRDLPTQLTQSLNSSIRLRMLAALAMNLMVGPDASLDLKDRAFGSTRVAPMQFMLGGGWRNALAQVRVMSVRLDDILRLPLPAPLHFVYPLLRLPLWLARRFSVR